MPGYPTGALPPWDQVTRQLKDFSRRLRLLEAAWADQPLTLLAGGSPATSGTADTVLWQILPPTTPAATVSLTLIPILSDGTAVASLTLQDNQGNVIGESGLIFSGLTLTIGTQAPATGPFTLVGRCSTGTLTVTVLQATAPRWVVDDST